MKKQYILSYDQGERLKALQNKIAYDCDLLKEVIDTDSEVALYLNRIETHARQIEDILVDE